MITRKHSPLSSFSVWVLVTVFNFIVQLNFSFTTRDITTAEINVKKHRINFALLLLVRTIYIVTQ